MKIKQIPEDFLVEEIFDLKNFLKESQEEKNQTYHYFKLTKKNYAQMRAIEKVSTFFNISRKNVHFSGTKDKVGITIQVISLFGLKKGNLEKNLEYFNEKLEDLNLEYLGEGNRRIALGDHLGNNFKITIRDLSNEEIEKIEKNFKNLEKNGVLNFFDEQRFGFAGNSHKVGLAILRNDLESAVKIILTSTPPKPTPDLEEFVNQVKNNYSDIKDANQEVINKLISIAPKFLRNEVEILKHLKNSKNDFPGAFRTIHKKLRTLYLAAYQSYIFNETIDKIDTKRITELPLIFNETEFEEKEVEDITKKLLESDLIALENFKLDSMPELRIKEQVKRETRIFPSNCKLDEFVDDELNEKKKKVLLSFDLEKGAYATNVAKSLF